MTDCVLDPALDLSTAGRPVVMDAPMPVARLLLTRPDHFDVLYAINPFMDSHAPVDRERAMAEWRAYREQLVAAGADVSEQPGAEGCPDIVFTANAALVLGKRALLSRFRYDERAGEVPFNAESLRAMGYAVEELPAEAGAFEGAADAMPFGGRLLVAHGPRTERSVVPYLERFSGLPAVEIELVDPRFYHLDLAFCPLDERRALVVSEAMTAESWAALQRVVPEPIELTLEEGLAFCCNAVVVGQRVFMHQVPARVGGLLAAAGYEAVAQPVGEFIKSGGSLACLALRLDRTAV